jgi:putative methyltransferase (TIGR04325 family)
MIHAKGYDDLELQNRNFEAIKSVLLRKSGFAQDGVTFENVQKANQWVSFFDRAETYSNTKLYLDFGGSFAVKYFQYMPEIISKGDSLAWKVIERPVLVEIVKRNLELFNHFSQVSFCSSLSEVPKVHKTDEFHIFSSSLQYMEDPYSILEESIARNPCMIFIDVLPTRQRRMVAGVQRWKAGSEFSYPLWIFEESSLIRFLSNYKLEDSWTFTPQISSKCEFKGFLFVRRNTLG